MSVVIIGGGIAGLAAAFELSERRVPFVLLEATDRLGGLILTEQVEGCTIDSGADSMLVQKPAALDLCEELGIEGDLISTTPPRTAYVHARGQLYPLPHASMFGIPTTRDALETYELLPPAVRADLIERLEALPTAPGSDDESVASFFRRHYGPETVGLIAEPLLGGIHAGDVEHLSVKLVASRLVDAVAKRLHRRAPDDQAPEIKNETPSPNGMFRSLTGGMGALVRAIEKELPPASILRRREVMAISADGDGYQIATTGEALRARAVIIAAPAHAAENMLAWLDPQLSSLCAEIPYVSTVSVALAWPRANIAHSLDGSGFVVARKHSALRITASTWVSSKWAGRAPEGVALLRAFMGGASDPDAVTLSDEELIDTAKRDLGGILGITGEPLFTRVHRWIRAGAQYNVGHSERIARIDERLAQIPGLFAAGSGFRAIGIPDCIADGRAQAATAARYIDDTIR